MSTLNCGHFLFIYSHLVCKLFTKTLYKHMSIKIYRPFVCDFLGQYILVVNNSLLVNLINYLDQLIF